MEEWKEIFRHYHMIRVSKRAELQSMTRVRGRGKNQG